MQDENAEPAPWGDADPGVHHHALSGHFELLAEVGSGSSGTVYRARLTEPYEDLAAGAEVAVKFLRRELLADERARERLLAEGELGKTLRHPNLATIYGVEDITVLGLPVTYLVMQFVHGTTLRDLAQRPEPPVEDLMRRIGADASKGLHALHRRGLLHRDVKPENLILTPDSELKIVDLGLVRPFGARGAGSGPSSGRSSGGVAGSVAYASPEALLGRPTGPRSDLYSLGIVLFEITTGRHPFADCTTADAMLDAHLNRTPPRPSHLRARVTPFLEQVLVDLLQKDPDQRPRSAKDLQYVLEQGEHSEYWRRLEARAPALAGSRRLRRLRRPAETPFFGRSSERSALVRHFARAVEGHGSSVWIAGPEGIGRRRLLDELLQEWLDGDEPPLFLGGEADSGFGHAEPFASSLVDVLLRGDDRDSPNAGPRLADSARQQLALTNAEAEALAAVALGHSTEPPEVRADRLASALLQLPRPGRPLVLRVDRAEQLDTSGRLVLQRLVAAAPTRPLLLLLVGGVDASPLATDLRLDLGGLDEDDFLAFGRALFRTVGDGEVDGDVEEFLRKAHGVLSGLPGNLAEALEQIALDGQLRGRAGDYHDLAPDAEPRPAPGHLRRFRQRVAGLDPQQRAVLSAAAVLGLSCQLGELAELVQSPELAVLETLSLFRGRIVRAQAGEVSFRHPDFRRALLEQLPPAERHQLHLRAAELLTARGREPFAIGMHRSQALDHEGCLDPLLDALDERVRAGSRRTSLRIAGRLALHLEHVPDGPENQRRRLRFLLLAGRARANVGQAAVASTLYRQAERLARDLDMVEESTAARTGLAALELDAGRLFSAIALLESVHDDLAVRFVTSADALAAQAHGLHGRILLYLGQATEGQRHLQSALKRLPPEIDDLRCHLLIDLARVEALRHHYTTALKTLQKVEREPAARVLPRVRLRLSLYRGQIRCAIGDDDGAQDLRFAYAEAERLSLPSYAGRASLFLGERQLWRRRFDEARTEFEQAVRWAQAGGDRLGEAMSRGYLLRLGADDEALAELVAELDLPSLRVNWLLALAARGKAGPAEAALVDELLDNADLSLPLHLRALAWLDRPASARSLVRTIGERFPSRNARRQFLAEWQLGARI